MKKFFWLIILLIGCAPQWHQTKIHISFDELWGKCSTTLQKHGYKIIQIDKEKQELQSDWKFALKALRGKGERTKVYIVIDSQKNVWHKLKVRVIREKNLATHDHLSKQQAIWQENGRDIILEQLILQDIEAELYLK